MEKTKTTMLQVKVSPETKDEIVHRAEQAGMNMSEYIRTVALSDEKITVLDKGSYIAKSLIEISTTLERSLRGKELTSELEEKLLAVLDDVYEQFDIITEQLTDIHAESEEE